MSFPACVYTRIRNDQFGRDEAGGLKEGRIEVKVFGIAADG